MIIKSNTRGLRSYNQLKKNNKELTKSLEKLSTGYKINRAGDDAAGLAISEKMRALISGMQQADSNVQQGINLIKVGEGALQEVHGMLDRVKTLATQSANGVYNDAVDRASMQKELDAICDEISRISQTTQFNGINLFQDIGFDAESSASAVAGTAQSPLSLADVLTPEKGSLKNIIYTETEYDFETTQAPAENSVTNTFNAEYQSLANTLRSTIIPGIVQALMEKYPAFDYLDGSSIGIGLKLEDNDRSNTLASVSAGISYVHSGSNYSSNLMTYKLTVNVASLKKGGVINISDPAIRTALEQTIAHEMIHAFMFEATTTGMMGIHPTEGSDPDEKFPSWFAEGMAQTASGPGNWTKDGLNLGQDPTAAEITAALTANKLGSGTGASEYGTGYLACMYLGYLAAGADAAMTDGAAAADISRGVSAILSQLIGGKSLDALINEVTGGKYSSLTAFENGFANDADALTFIDQLLDYTSTADANQNVGGGLLSGDLSVTDPGSFDSPLSDSDLNLFALNTTVQEIANDYTNTGITVLSGGGVTTSGTAPTPGYTPVAPTPPVTPTPPPTITYPLDLFSVNTAGTKGIDWDYDESTGILTVLTDTAIEISGGTKTDGSETYYGSIVIADNITDADITLKGIEIDTSSKDGAVAGIAIGANSTVNLKVQGTNTIVGDDTAAGIQVSDTSSLTINTQDGSVLTVTGGTKGSTGGAAIGGSYQTNAGDITITGSGTINATGGYYASGIGGSYQGTVGNITITGSGIINAASGEGAGAIGAGFGADCGDILINGSVGSGGQVLTVNATADDHGAGIGGGWTSASEVGDITIKGAVTIEASGVSHGTGIGAGCSGSVQNITIGEDRADNSQITITAQGGDDGAAIGASWTGTCGDIVIHGGTITATGGLNGAGIGSGSSKATCGTITINGGVVTATGSTDASGIGSGKQGTVTGVVINGGTITADGGWTNDGGNIGGYTDTSGTSRAPVTINQTNPSSLSIKAGLGEGKYVIDATDNGGATDGSANTLYALDLSYIQKLLDENRLIPTAGDSTLVYPLKVQAISVGGTTHSWENLQHDQEQSAYIWMPGNDIQLLFEDPDGTQGSTVLKFYPDYGLWRLDETDLPAELPKRPEYHNPVSPSTPVPPALTGGGIILQVGADRSETMEIPRFYFSRTALGLGDLDISTQENAQISMTVVENMIERVSEIRGTYGAFENALGHIAKNLNVGVENLTDAESNIRDTDMAEEMMRYTKSNILIQSAQAMLAQANQLPEGVLQLMQ